MSIPPSARRFVQWQESHTLLTDTVIATAIVLLNIPMGFRPMLDEDFGEAGNAAIAVTTVTVTGLVCGFGMCIRRLKPTLSWGLVTFAPLLHALVVPRVLELELRAGTYVALSMSAFSVIGVPVLLGTLATRQRLSLVWAACTVSTVTAALSGCLVPGLPVSAKVGFFDLLLPFALVNVIGTLTGIILRIQRAQVLELAQRNDRLALAREQAAALAAANERSRIAREMHDVVAHSLAVMITMSDGAAAAVDRNPEMAKQALAVLAETGRSALADTRRLVGVLRDDPGASSDPARKAAMTSAAEATAVEPTASSGPVPAVRALPVPEFAPPGTVAPTEPSAEIEALRRRATEVGADRSTGDLPTAPAPESADLAVLVERFTTAGVPVDYDWLGDPLPDDKGLQLTVFRIAQEAMTNVLRYAPTTKQVQVRLVRRTGTAVLTIDNDAAPGSTPVHGSGKGLIGMRERAAVYGGTVDAGPTPTGWRVRAVLRWDESNEGTTSWQMPQ